MLDARVNPESADTMLPNSDIGHPRDATAQDGILPVPADAQPAGDASLPQSDAATCESILLTPDAFRGFLTRQNLPCADFAATGEACEATVLGFRMVVRAREDISLYFAPPTTARFDGQNARLVVGANDIIGGWNHEAVQCLNIAAAGNDRILDIDFEADYGVETGQLECAAFEYGARRTDLTVDPDGVCDELTQVVPGSRRWSIAVLYGNQN